MGLPDYVAKYRHTFTDDCGRTVVVALLKKSYVGGFTEIALLDEPARRSDGDGSSPEYFRRRASVCFLSVENVAVLNDINGDSTPWQASISIGGLEDLSGPILKAKADENLDDYPDGFSLAFYCGLGDLALIPFTDDTGVPNERTGLDALGKQPLLFWIFFLLNKLGQQRDFAVASDLYAYGMSAAPPLEQEYYGADTWWPKDQATPPMCGDLLDSILAQKGMFVHQRQGLWHIYARSLFFGSVAFGRWLYDWDYYAGGSASFELFGSRTTISTPSSSRVSPARLSYRPAYNQATISYVHGAITSLFPNSGFQNVIGESLAEDWTHGGAIITSERGALIEVRAAGTQQIGSVILPLPAQFIADREARLRVVRSLQAESPEDGDTLTSTAVAIEASALDKLLLLADLTIPLSAEAQADTSYAPRHDCSFQLIVSDGIETYWLWRAGFETIFTWESVPRRAFFRVSGGGDQRPALELPAPPIDGDLTLIIESAWDQSFKSYDSLPTVYPSSYVYYKSFVIQPVLAGSTSPSGVTTYRATLSTEGEELGGFTVSHGSGPTAMHASAAVDVAGNLLKDWGRGIQGAPSGRTAAEYIIYEHLLYLGKERRVLECTYDSDVAGSTSGVPSPIRAVDDSGLVALPVFAEYDYRACEMTILAPELLQGDAPVLSTDPVTFAAGSRALRTGEYLPASSVATGVLETLFQKIALTQLSASLAAGEHVSLPIEPIAAGADPARTRLRIGDELYLVDLDALAVYTVVVAADVTETSAAIPIQPFTFPRSVPADVPVLAEQNTLMRNAISAGGSLDALLKLLTGALIRSDNYAEDAAGLEIDHEGNLQAHRLTLITDLLTKKWAHADHVGKYLRIKDVAGEVNVSDEVVERGAGPLTENYLMIANADGKLVGWWLNTDVLDRSKHTGTQDWATIDNTPATFPPASHNHGIGDIETLQDELTAINNALTSLQEQIDTHHP